MPPPSNPGESPILLRPLLEADIPFAMELKEAAGWNQTLDDWRNLLGFRPPGCFAALRDGRPVGTVTTIEYPGGLGWIGMLLVHPEHRRRGIGKRLLLSAMESLGDCGTVKLDATPSGREVYAPLGFEDECVLERRGRIGAAAGGRVGASSARGIAVRGLTATDLPAVAAFDAEAFGAPRGQVLEAWFRGASRYALLCEASGRLRGYCLGRRGSRLEHIGPLVAESIPVAEALLLAALESVGPRGPLIDAPAANPEWLRLLDGLGFAVERRFLRMRRGEDRCPADMERQWAIAGPEVG